MSYANSKIPDSAQQGVHEKLAEHVIRHRDAPFRKPYADYNRQAFDTAMDAWGGDTPLILDAGCGVGHSTIALARAYPDHFVMGVDQSEDRLNRRKPYPEALLPKNMQFIRADLVDFWRLMVDAEITLARHYLLYPNPWPKIGHVGRRWPAHPVFPFIPKLGGMIECRTNWRVYIEEFAMALGLLIDRDVAWETFEAPSPLTPFERKYRDSGQPLYRASADLNAI